MSDPPKHKKFHLPSSLRHLQQTKKHQTDHLIRELQQPQAQSKPQKQRKQHSLFKLNPSSEALVGEVAVDVLRKRSNSSRLEREQREKEREGFSLLQHHREAPPVQVKQRKQVAKKYDVDLREMTSQPVPRIQQQIQQQQKYQTVKPSQTYVPPLSTPSIYQPTLFQTPILPCFASEFKDDQVGSKQIREGEGLWRIGRMKVGKGGCQLRIGEMVFQGGRVRGQGRAGIVGGGRLHQVQDWQGIWVLQPRMDQ